MPPQDPRYLPAAGPTVPGQGFTRPTLMTPEQQDNQVRILLNDVFRAGLPDTDPLYLPMDPTSLQMHETALSAWGHYAPDLLQSVARELSGTYGYTPGDGTVSVDAGVAAMFNEILSTAEVRSEEIRQTTTGHSNVDRSGNRTHEEITNASRTRFVDLPTPEEFMNDFNVGLASWVQGLRSKNLITEQTADWIRFNPDLLYERYLTDLADRAAKGEDIYQVVGLDGEPVRLGQRSGGTESAITSSIDRSRVYEQVENNERTQIEEEVISEFTTTGTVETTEQQQQVNTEVDRRLDERTTQLINEAIEYWGAESEITTEQVFSRPQLATVFKISPNTFLSSAFTPVDVENLAANKRGAGQAQLDTARGIRPSGPRRAGGV